MLILYSTLGCHLCEQALYIIQHECRIDVAVSIVDIADDEHLMETYGVRIPVLKHQSSGAELGWPFSAEQCLEWFEHCNVQEKKKAATMFTQDRTLK